MTQPRSKKKIQLCPNLKRHFDEGTRWQQGTAPYKRDQLMADFKRGFHYDQQSCDYCNPPCPTCGHRKPRAVAEPAKSSVGSTS